MIALDLQTFRQSREDGNVTGVIFLELRGGAFPERGWSDFPVIILGWWTDAWLQLVVPTRREVVWRFMDGPEAVTLTKASNADSADTYESSQVHRSLVEVGERVVAHCEQNKMLSRDLVVLRGNMERLEASHWLQATPGFALLFSIAQEARRA